jgi:hypothetical protein
MAYLAATDSAKYQDALHRKTSARELDRIDERASTKALLADVLFGATAVTAVITVVVALQGGRKHEALPRREDTAHVRLTVGPGSLRLRGGF